MAIGTTDVKMSDIATEMGYGPSAGNPISLGGLMKATNMNIKSSTYFQIARQEDLSYGQVQMASFKEYDKANLIFKFVPEYGYDGVANVGGDGGASTAPPTSNSGSGHAFTNGSNAPSATTSGAGYAVYDYTGGNYTASPGTTGDWAYFSSTVTSNSFRSNWLSAGGVSTLVFWLKLDSAPSANTCIIDLCLDDDPSAYPHNTPYSGIQFIVDNTGRIRWVMGDGGGIATADRRTFASSTNTMADAEWYMWVIQCYGTGGSEVSTSLNYSWMAYESDETITGAGQFLSGSGGNISWEHNATADKDTMYFNSGAQGNRYFDGQLGHVMLFSGTLSTTEMQRLYDRMKSYYY